MHVRILALLPALALMLAACGSAGPTATGGSPQAAPTSPPEAVSAAVRYLAAHLNIAPERVTVVSVLETRWSDSSLGCPQPGMSYLQVITPGYQIWLEADGHRYGIHTNQSGSSLVLCER